MSETTSPARLIVGGETRPHLPAYLKLRHDAGRDRWILLAPERVLTPDQTAVAVLKLCDGKRSVEEIVGGARQGVFGAGRGDPRPTCSTCCKAWLTRDTSKDERGA